jgi:CelD/BcsL family acetyltransferase involved in cellulose biosynthesis
VTSPHAIQVRRVETDEGFDALQPDWDRLVDSLPVASPFQSWHWANAWRRRLGGDNSKLRILVFESGGSVMGIAQFYERKHIFGRYGMTSLVPVGGGKGHQNITEQLQVIFPAPVRAALLCALSDCLRGLSWTAIVLGCLKEDDSLPAWLASRVISSRIVPYHYRDLPNDWSQFIPSLNKSMRDNAKYYPRLMARSGHPYEFTVAHTSEQMREFLPTLLGLHRERAHAQGRVRHPDYFANSRRRAFLADIMPRLASRGEARIGVLSVANEPVAAILWLEKAHGMFLCYSGYRQSWSKYSVAMVATLEAFKDGLKRGLRRVEFLAGEGPTETRWETTRYTRRYIVLGRWPRLAKPALALRGLQRRLRAARP